MAPSIATSTCTEVSESPSRKSETPSNVSDVEAIFMPKISLAGSGKAGASPASSVHELLECPVCTNSIYLPINQDLLFYCVGCPQVVLRLGRACIPHSRESFPYFESLDIPLVRTKFLAEGYLIFMVAASLSTVFRLSVQMATLYVQIASYVSTIDVQPADMNWEIFTAWLWKKWQSLLSFLTDIRFLEFFGNFDWENYAVSVWGPVPLSSLPDMAAEPPRKDGGELLLSKQFLDGCVEEYCVKLTGQDNNQGRAFTKKHQNIVDPLRRSNNLGHSVNQTHFIRIKSGLRQSAKELLNILLDSSKGIDEYLISGKEARFL